MKQPRTKCKTNQHKKRAVTVFVMKKFDHYNDSVTFDWVKVPRRDLAKSTTESCAELLGYMPGASYEWRPQR